jgi:TonB-linked SusC/RagA family outer membrane protein
VEAGTLRPLNGVQVTIAGSNRGALTNAQGFFLMVGVPTGSHSVVAHMIGFERAEQTATVVPGEAAEVNFQLAMQVIALDEVVVTGTPGATQRRALPNSVTSVAAEQLTEKAPVTNVTQLLQGRTPGLTVMQGSGQAGTASNFRIRGAGSLNASNHPVFYVDGIRISSGSQGGFGTDGNTRRETSALDMLNPEDIESIEVIKGPAAAALYGADAAAGVIQIITKKGKTGQQGVQWSAKAEYGQTDWHLPMRENYTLCTNAGELSHTATSISRITHANWAGCHDMDPNAPWQDRLLVETPLAGKGVLRTGQQTAFNLSARGGSDVYSFYVSGNREREDGVFSNNNFTRNSGLANFTVRPQEQIDVSFSAQYSLTSTQQPQNDNASNGWLRNSWRGLPGNSTAPFSMGWRGMGPEQMRIYDDVTDSERFIMGTTINYRPTSWFTNRLTMGMDAGDRKITLFYPIGSDQHGYSQSYANGYISNLDRTQRDYTINYSGTISNDLTDELTSALSFGAQYRRENYRSVQTIGEGLIADVVKNIDVDNNIDTRTYESRRQVRSLGFFVEEQVGWRNRLFVTGTMRVDDHSTFGSQFSTVFYPKGGVSYVISEESFFNIDAISNLRLRAGYGHAGNPPAPFAADRVYGASNVVMDDGSLAPALTPHRLGNPDLRAERGSELELGFEASLFNNAIGLEVTHYNKTTNDALINVPVPPSTGFPSPVMRNVGKISNSGIEVAITGSPMRTPTLSWDAQASFATNRNRMVDLGEDRPFIPVGYRSSQRHQKGYPLAGYWAAVVERDANGDVVFDGAGRPVLKEEMEYVGPSAPTREAALTNTFTLFGDLQFYVFMDYKGGHYLYNMSDQTSIDDGNHRLANDPRVSREEWQLLRYGGNRPFIEKADFVKLREISVRYNFPNSWAQRVGTDALSLTLAGRNLGVWSKYSGADPEVNIGGASDFTRAESNSVPMMRRLVATLNVRF